MSATLTLPTVRSARRRRARVAADALESGATVMLVDDVGPCSRIDLMACAVDLSVAQCGSLIRHSSGFLQVALRDPVCDRLQIPPVAPGPSRTATQQCVGVDAVGVGTGISAVDRTRTINALGARDSSPDDFTRPGHVVPVRVSASPPVYDVGGLVLTMAEAAGARAAVFATLVSATDGTALMGRDEAQFFAAHNDIPVVFYSEALRVHAA